MKNGRLVSTFFLAALVGSAGSAAADTITHHYSVSLDAKLSRLDVEARFERPVTTVTARSRRAGRYLLDVGGCDDATEIRLRNRRMLLPDHGVTCLRYSVDLAAAATAYRNNRYLDPGNVVVSSSSWLWRPELFDDTRIAVDFDLPEGMSVSVPWASVGDSGRRFLLQASPESASAPAVFGRFNDSRVEVPGAELRVALLNGRQPMDVTKILEWVHAAASNVSLAYGRFPNPSPQVVILPVGGGRSSSPVSFGRVIRDGGETVELFIDPAQPLESFLTDWTATHEFSHLMHPYLQSEYHWITEGFAGYYQNILLARAGAYEPRDAWQRLYAGYERGRESRPELSPNEAAAGNVRSGRMKVYWSGAALALMADVTLRERSGGSETLDSVLGRFQSCCLPSDQVWTGVEFFSKLDALAGSPVFMPLYRRYADTAGFPDTGDVFERLGLRVSDGEVHIRHRAELADVRQAIMRTDASTSAWQEQLASD